MTCPGSVELSKGTENESNEASIRGTGAHALAVELLSGHDYGVGDVIKFEDSGEKTSAIIDDDLLAGVLVYTEYINNLAEYMINPELWLEQKVSFHGEKGTADAILKDRAILHVIDYKNGRVAVHVKEGDTFNPQLLIYAYAALKKFDKHGEIQQVILTIVQPNCPEVESIQKVEIPASDVRRWGDIELKKAMKTARGQNAALVPGDHCRWCPAAGKCPALVAHVNDLAAADFTDVAEPVLPQASALTIPQVANIMKWAPVLDHFIAAVAARALEDMQRGVIYPGFKLVRKKTNRAYPTEKPSELRNQLVEAGAPNSITTDDLLGERPLLSPAQLEKRFKWAKVVNPKVATKAEGDLTVAPSTDPRDEVRPAADFKDFDPEELI